MINQPIFSLLEQSEKRRFWVLFLNSIIFSFIEAFALVLIIPYIQMLQDPERMLQYGIIQQVFTALSLTPTEFNIFCLFTFGFILVFLLRTALFTWISYETAHLSYDFFSGIANKLQKKYLFMRYVEFSLRNSNLLVKNCTKTAEIVGYALVLYLQYLSALIVIVVLCLLLLWENPIVSSLVFLVLGLGTLFLLNCFKNRQKKGGEIREWALSEMHRHTSESFLAFKEIQLYRKFTYFMNQFNHVTHKYAKSLTNHIFFQAIPPMVLELIAFFILIVSASYFILNDKPLVELVPPLMFYAAVIKRMMPNLHKIVTNKVGFQNYIPSIELVRNELQIKSDPHSNITTDQLSFLSTIEFRDVTFSYPNHKDVLHGISFTVEKNQSIAFVGPSGAGKSTLIEILISLLKPKKGTFHVDGNQVQNLQGIKHLIGYVPQMVNLLDTTIAENIAFCEEEIDQNKLINAIKMAHLEDFITTLPDGAQTVIGERGIKISGGQRQRIGIARALYRDPEILIFDEATSSLDNISENIIQRTIEEIAGHKTIIAIAHRLSTVQHFDLIYVINHGQIIASGTHTQLLEECSTYQQLYYLGQKKQKIDEDSESLCEV